MPCGKALRGWDDAISLSGQEMHSAEIDDKGGASGNDGVVGEGNGLTSEDIGSREACQTRRNLIVVTPRDATILVRVVDIDEDSLFQLRMENGGLRIVFGRGEVAEVGVGVVARKEVEGAALLNSSGGLTPLPEAAVEIVEVVLLGVAAFGGEEVHVIVCPATAELTTPGAVATVLGSHKHLLVAEVGLRDAAKGGEKGGENLHLAYTLTADIAHTLGVVVGSKDHHVREVVVGEVVREGIVDARHAFAPAGLILAHGVDEGIAQREVHDGGQMAVKAVLIGCATLPVGQLRHALCPALAHDVQARVLVHDGLTEARAGHLLVVGIGVDADAVEAAPLHPPDGELLEVLQHEGVIEVHVGHRGGKPAALLIVEVLRGGVWVHVRGEADVGAGVLGELMYPVVEGEVLHPPVGSAAVVGHEVSDNLDAEGMATADILAIEVVGAVAGVDVVVVGAGVTVETGVALVVECEGRTPDGSDTEVAEIVEMVDDALDVAAMTAEGILTVGALDGGGGGIVCGVAVGEAVGHDEIDHVGRGETLALSRAFNTLVKGVGITPSAGRGREEKVESAGRGSSINGQIDEEVVGAVGLVDSRDADTIKALDADVASANAVGMHKKLKRLFHARPPA